MLLPIPPLLLRRRLRSSSPSSRSAVKSNTNGKENKEAANGDLGKWLCSASASGFRKLPESLALIGKANFLSDFLLSLGYFCRLLIFDNIETGSLKEHLNGILIFFSDPPAYHVSISLSNIMLDENFTAKVRK
ncbi:uncharacterized protein LOC107466123 [Arachis duranensis]|uniref:Uncharacterized protein LOC107466123 n=1 Tax=Arachis duranensis TaxID=130453 RepID=A0A9C6T5F6_ARADU|nr:uncharacterized protein LOC107466123 [Arachis duranensis]